MFSVLFALNYRVISFLLAVENHNTQPWHSKRFLTVEMYSTGGQGHSLPGLSWRISCVLLGMYVYTYHIYSMYVAMYIHV